MMFESNLANPKSVIKIAVIFDELINRESESVFGKLKGIFSKKEVKIPLIIDGEKVEVIPLGFSIKHDECHIGVSPVHKGFSKHIKRMANNTEVSVIFNVDVDFKRYQIEVLNSGKIAYAPKSIDKSFVETIVSNLLNFSP